MRSRTEEATRCCHGDSGAIHDGERTMAPRVLGFYYLIAVILAVQIPSDSDVVDKFTKEEVEM